MSLASAPHFIHAAPSSLRSTPDAPKSSRWTSWPAGRTGRCWCPGSSWPSTKDSVFIEICWLGSPTTNFGLSWRKLQRVGLSKFTYSKETWFNQISSRTGFILCPQLSIFTNWAMMFFTELLWSNLAATCLILDKTPVAWSTRSVFAPSRRNLEILEICRTQSKTIMEDLLSWFLLVNLTRVVVLPLPA